MAEDDRAARARVEAVLEVARRIADPTSALGKEARASLATTTRLSPEGIERALTKHLETSANEADLASLLATVGRARRCGVVLSANVCTAAVRATALALATSPEVLLRPSRREPGLAPILARELASNVSIVSTLDLEAGDELHIYGRDETVTELTATAGAGVIVRGHGAGFGVATIVKHLEIKAAAAALANDVIAFDQAGCLSPRIAFVEDPSHLEAFADALHSALDALAGVVPRGALDAATTAELALYTATVAGLGDARIGEAHVIGVDASPRALVLPPPARALHLVAASPEIAARLIKPLARFVTIIGGEDPVASAIAALAPGARHAPLGAMQSPPLDGPVDRRARG